MEEAFGRTEDQIGRVVAVTVEGTFTHPVLASVFFEREAASSSQGEKIGFAFHAINFRVGDSGHGSKRCQVDLRLFISASLCVILANSHQENAKSLNSTSIVMPKRHQLMTDPEVKFFKSLGSRVAQARKEQGLTQSELAELLGDVTQPMIASYEIGRRKIPATLLPPLSRELRIPIAELLGEELKNSKRGPAPKLQKQLEAVSELPKQQQQFVSKFLDTVLNQARA
ncbi:MAG: transcriptional regulator with XRE-family HTH domain [Akkermansiaceae bacterium]